MAILCGIEEHELFVNCFRGSQKNSGLQKGQQNEVVKSNFLQNLYHNCLMGPIIQAVKSRRSKRKSEDDHEET